MFRDMSEITQERLQAIMERHPNLDKRGYPSRRLVRREDVGGPEYARSRAGLPASLEEVREAARWLSRQSFTEQVSRRAPSSYALKHMAEEDLGIDMPNGAIIAACLLMNVSITRNETPNPRVGVSQAGLKIRARRNSCQKIKK